MGSIIEFNRYASTGRAEAEKYCKIWKMDLDKRNKEIADLLKANKIDNKTYNQKRLGLNNEIKDLNKCVGMLNK